jgi:hypothetical protein
MSTPPFRQEANMADLLFLGIIVAFFALMVLFVRFCEHIVGKDMSDVTQSDNSPALVAGEVAS